MCSRAAGLGWGVTCKHEIDSTSVRLEFCQLTRLRNLKSWTKAQPKLMNSPTSIKFLIFRVCWSIYQCSRSTCPSSLKSKGRILFKGEVHILKNWLVVSYFISWWFVDTLMYGCHPSSSEANTYTYILIYLAYYMHTSHIYPS